MKFYNVTLRCPEKKLQTLMSVVSGEMTLVKVEPEGETASKNKQMRYAGGLRNKGISGKDLFLKLLANGPKTADQIKKSFIDQGFAATSHEATGSTLRNEKKIERDKDGKWSLSKKK